MRFLQVTAEDIQGATPGRNGQCPIARALRRVTGQPWRVNQFEFWQHDESVDEWWFEDRVFEVDHDSTGVRRYINAFDEGYSVEPCTIDIGIDLYYKPEESV